MQKLNKSQWGGLALAMMVPLTTILIGGTASASSPATVMLPQHDAMVSQQIAKTLSKIDTLNPTSSFSFGIILPSRNPSGLKTYANGVSQPGSPIYHQFLTKSQAALRFGPDPSVVSNLAKHLTAAGLKTTVSGQLMQVSGTVAQVNKLLQTQMTRYKWNNSTLIAPAGGTATLPTWLRGVAGLTGLVVSPPTPGIVQPHHGSMSFSPKSSMAATPNGSTATATHNNFTVSVQRLSDAARAPGEAVRYKVTATLKGQPDPNPLTIHSLTGPYFGATPMYNWYYGMLANQVLMDFTVSQQQYLSLAMTVMDSAGNEVKIQLPAAAFLGPSAKTTNATSLNATGMYGITGQMVAPWNPASNSVNTAMNAQEVVGQEKSLVNLFQYQAPPGFNFAPRIGVFTMGGIKTSGSISFSQPEQDALKFSQKFGRIPPTFHVGYVGPNSIANTSYGGIEGEMSLDLQMMETSAPGANIYVYSAGSLRNALSQVDAQDKINVYSISYGAGDQVVQALEPGAQASWDQLAQYANALGITISVSAGDNAGYSGAQYNGLVPSSVANAPQPSYPASSSYVTAIGGTENSVGITGHVNQSALWGGNLGRELSTSGILNYLSYGNMMGSGGVSSVESAPSYQLALNPNLTGRMTPDVSLPASVITPGYFGYFNGQPGLAGGTSAGAPLFAGYIADMSYLYYGGFGNVNPTLYAMSQRPAPSLPAGPVVNSVAFGDNGPYGITPRDNPVTGLGQFNVDGFANGYFGGGGSGPAPGSFSGINPTMGGIGIK